MVKQKGLNILTSGFSFSSTAQPVTVFEALYVLSGKRTKLHEKHLEIVYWFTHCHIQPSSLAFCLR